jgi:hypothetical protein
VPKLLTHSAEAQEIQDLVRKIGAYYNKELGLEINFEGKETKE